MTKKQQKELIKVGNLIITGETYCICDALSIINYKLKIKNYKELMMFDPNSIFWWKATSMNSSFTSEYCRNARLMGIAFAYSMPKEILNGKCCKKK